MREGTKNLHCSSTILLLTVTVTFVAGPAIGVGPQLQLLAEDAKRLGPAIGSEILDLASRHEKACVVMTMTCNSTRTGVLDNTDCDLPNDTRVDFWEFQGAAGQTVTINLTSNQFDTVLFLLDPIPEVVASDDDGGAGTNSRLQHVLDASGTWTIAANNFFPGDLGNYSVQLQCSGGVQTPAAPSNLTATPFSTTEIRLDWNDNSNNENQFRIELRGPGTGFSDIGSVAANSTAVNVTDLDPMTTYDFRVRARNGAGNSAYSNVASATTFGGAPGVCTPSATNLCLLDDRFEVRVTWRNFENVTGQAMVVPFGSADSGLFYFFDADNWEMLVKMVDACNSPFNSFWVFAAATTNVQYTLRVTDTERGLVKTYSNPLGNAAPAITDTSAFATCP